MVTSHLFENVCIYRDLGTDTKKYVLLVTCLDHHLLRRKIDMLADTEQKSKLGK
jgi:hypothetical protein